METAAELGFHVLWRYAYDIGPEELVIDAGGYDGRWAADIALLYDPRIVVFEPVPRFADLCRRRLHSNPKAVVHEAALGTENGPRLFNVASNDSSFYREGRGALVVTCADVAEALTAVEVALLKLNIEGEEYAVLRRMLNAGTVSRCRDIQVQFHRFGHPEPELERERIRARLQETHRLTYDVPFVFENWRRK